MIWPFDRKPKPKPEVERALEESKAALDEQIEKREDTMAIKASLKGHRVANHWAEVWEKALRDAR